MNGFETNLIEAIFIASFFVVLALNLQTLKKIVKIYVDGVDRWGNIK